jgi:hypothetical protein
VTEDVVSDAVEAAEKPKQEPPPTAFSHALGCLLLAALVGGAGWGVFSVGSCTVRGVQKFNKGVEEASREYDQIQAAEKARAGASDDGATYSDTTVTASALQAVKSQLVDPDSAKFRSVRVYQQASGTKAVCGEVNAKNRAGGFNGYERFVSAGTSQHTWLEQQVSGFESVWSQVCR